MMVIKDSNKVFFTSDFHANHKRIIEFCNRPWESKEEMTENLIKNWNSVVGPDDIIFHLGDFCWSGSWNTILEKLNGQEHKQNKPRAYKPGGIAVNSALNAIFYK
mgnify:CR=1 FL=1